MISIYDTATLTAALAQPMKAELRGHIERHILLARQNGLAADATHLVVIQPGDTERQIEAETGFSPVVDQQGLRYGDPGFIPYWDHLQDLGDHFELIDTIGNSGFAFILLIEQAEGVWSELLALCQQHCHRPG